MARNVVCVVVLLALAAAAAPAPSEAAPPVTRGSIERFDPRLDELIAPDASLELIADGFHWVEGPVWDKREGCLYFSDIPANAVYRWRQGEGTRGYW